ncbi:MAG TPA: copper chaperone PCu(A)C [Roseomonas sp.]|nr:copper chaperone PCu(A)C [Roseomonas sp.]
MRRRKLLVMGSGLSLLSAVGVRAQEQAAQLVAEQAWSRPALARIGTAVAYLRVRNIGAAPVQLLGATTPVAARVEIHESVVEDGVARMRPHPEGVPVAPGGEVAFEPGGLHLMLLDLHSDLKAKEVFPLTLRFTHGTALEVAVIVSVRAPAAQGSHSGRGH